MLWGKPMWGTYWVWDPRLTAQLVLLFLYLGYMALRSGIDDLGRADRAVADVHVRAIVSARHTFGQLHSTARKRMHARGNYLGAEKHVDAVSIDNLCCHGPVFEPISSSRANRISRSSAFSGGAATRVRKLVDSPGLSARKARDFQIGIDKGDGFGLLWGKPDDFARAAIDPCGIAVDAGGGARLLARCADRAGHYHCHRRMAPC